MPGGVALKKKKKRQGKESGWQGGREARREGREEGERGGEEERTLFPAALVEQEPSDGAGEEQA